MTTLQDADIPYSRASSILQICTTSACVQSGTKSSLPRDGDKSTFLRHNWKISDSGRSCVGVSKSLRSGKTKKVLLHERSDTGKMRTEKGQKEELFEINLKPVLTLLGSAASNATFLC